jgi:hypothetical protein
VKLKGSAAANDGSELEHLLSFKFNNIYIFFFSKVKKCVKFESMHAHI